LSWRLERHGEVAWISFPHLEVPHGSSTRLGGISQGPYASLNLGRHSGDALDLVVENRRIFGQVLGLEVPFTLAMTHGTAVAIVEHREQSGLEADACLTRQPGVGLALTTADCVPVLFADPTRGVVGLAHAGWRGTAGRIVQATVDAMAERFGSRPQDVRAAVGPAIRPCCFLVHEDVSSHFTADYAHLVQAVEERSSVDLQEANRLQLVEMGVPVDQVVVCDLCTSCCQDLFFSYRRDGQRSGRMASAIGLPG
jgi:YfiH family protein